MPGEVFDFFMLTASPYVVQASLELLDSSNLSTSAFQSAGITDVSHHAQSLFLLIFLLLFVKQK